MKRFLLLAIVTLCSVFSWAQSSVVQMGEAVVRCNDFAFAKTMLLNEGLSVVKSSKQNNANTIVMSNGSESTYSILYVILTKYPKSKKIKKCVFKFSPYGRFFNSLSREQIRFGYSYSRDNDTIFRELYKNDNRCMGIDINAKNWMVVTFFRAD